MLTLTKLTRNGLMAAMLLASPVLSQTDPSRPADTSTTSSSDDRRDDGFNLGWLGLLGLAGLAGLRRQAPQTVLRTDDKR